jgi:FkbM family methyltransferase
MMLSFFIKNTLNVLSAKEYSGAEKFEMLKTYLVTRLTHGNAGKIFGRVVQAPSNFSLIFREIFIERVYYFDDLPENPSIIDCGGHAGLATIYYKHLRPNARVLAFEPISWEAFEHNTSRFKDVTLLKNAVAKTEGETEMYWTPENTAGATIFPSYLSGHHATVTMVKLSNYITESVDLLKIDIEGAENDVIQELADSNKLPLVKRIAVEANSRYNAFPKILDKNGFSLLGRTGKVYKYIRA